MIILNNAFQSPSPMEATQIANSVLQNNRSLNEAVLDYTAQEIRKNNDHFQQNIAVISAETTGKGLALDIRG